MSSSLSAPVRLDAFHQVSTFDCGIPELTTWLKRYAGVNQIVGSSRVFVTCRANRVAGYYSLSNAVVEDVRSPNAFKKWSKPIQIQSMLLTRLARDATEQGSGLGRSLVADAVKRTLVVAEAAGLRSLSGPLPR